MDNKERLQQYEEAESDLEKAERDLELVNQRHGGGSGDFIPGQPITYLDVEHPKVKEACERVERASQNVVEMRRQLRDSTP